MKLIVRFLIPLPIVTYTDHRIERLHDTHIRRLVPISCAIVCALSFAVEYALSEKRSGIACQRATIRQQQKPNGISIFVRNREYPWLISTFCVRSNDFRAFPLPWPLNDSINRHHTLKANTTSNVFWHRGVSCDWFFSNKYLICNRNNDTNAHPLAPSTSRFCTF